MISAVIFSRKIKFVLQQFFFSKATRPQVKFLRFSRQLYQGAKLTVQLLWIFPNFRDEVSRVVIIEERAVMQFYCKSIFYDAAIE